MSEHSTPRGPERGRRPKKAGRGPSRHEPAEGVLATRVLAVVGLVVAAAALATGLVTGEWQSWTVLAMLGAAAVLVTLFFLTNWRWLLHYLVTKKALISLNLVVMVAVAAAIVAMANVISYRHFWRRDFSKSQLYQLSSQTRNLIGALQGEVSILVFYDPGTVPGVRFADYLRRLLAEYTLASDQITTKFVRLDQDPARVRELTKKYEVTTPNTVVVAAGEQRKNVPATDIVRTEPARHNMPGMADGGTIYAGEPALTAAIQAVTETRQKKVYFVTGHKERSPTDFGEMGYSSAARALRGANYEVPEPLNLLAAAGVPEDGDLLIIAGPTQPFEAREVEALGRYLEAGRPALFLLDPETDDDFRFVRFGFEPLLEGRAVTVKDALVLDPKSAYLYASNPIPTEVATYHEITRQLEGVTLIFQYARALEGATGGGDYRAAALLRTSPGGWGETNLQTEDRGQPTGGGADLLEDASKRWRPNQWVGGELLLLTRLPGEVAKVERQSEKVVASTETTVTIARKFGQIPDGKKEQQYALRKSMSLDEDQDLKGPLTLALASARRAGPPSMGGEPTEETHRLVVVGDSDFASNNSIEGVPGNRDFFLNSVGWLLGQSQQIGIRPKRPELAGLSLSTTQMKAVIWLVLVAMPAAVILTGCVVWWLRRLG